MQFYSLKITGRDWKLHHATGVDGIKVVLWELLAADVESIESIGAVGAMFEEVLLGFVIFLARLVLVEAVASALHSSRLDGEDKVIIVLTVEERHQGLLPGKTLVDEKVLKVHFDLVKSEVSETFVCHIELHLSEDGFRLYASSSPMPQALFRSKSFSSFSPVFRHPVVDFDFPVAPCREAPTPKRAPFAATTAWRSV